MPRKVVDWEAVEMQYRAGIRSLKDIGAEFDCSDAAIIKRARRDGWVRNLNAKIQAKAEAKVSASVVSGEVSARTKLRENEVVEANATAVALVSIGQRRDIARTRTISMSLLAELEKQTGPEAVALLENLGELMRSPDDKGADKLNDLYQKIISLPGRSKTLKDLTESLRILVTLERQAYGIEAGEGAESTAAAATGAAARALSDAERAVRLAHLLRTPGAVSPGLAAAFTGPDA